MPKGVRLNAHLGFGQEQPMSGYDKQQAAEQLKAQGWTEAPELGEYMLRPPRALLEKLAAMHFHVYDARDLQAFAQPPADEAEA
jgi:hypothetical protein